MDDSRAPVPVRTSREAHRLERFQSLAAGQYWRARRAVPEQGIDEGEVLLIQSIRWVDDAPHTVILRPHPTKIGGHFPLREQGEDGRTWTRHVRYDEHRFLLDDFLARFEYEPDHQRIRNEELAGVQKRVAALQSELVETQSDPARLARVVEEGLKAQVGEVAPAADGKKASNAADSQLPAVRQEMISLATGTVARAIEAGLTEQGIEEIKAAAEREHRVATIKAKWIEGKTQEIAETISAMTPFYEEQAAAALAQTEDVRTYITKLTEGIASLDLYVGKGVEVETLREGEPAPVDEPLTFVQRKLFMDEELAVWADVDERFDFQREQAFFDALENASLVEQIFPTPRCVLVMAVNRRHIDYGCSLTNMVTNEHNHKVFLLVRNGENIYRVFSPVESHLGAARLFPSKDEQGRIFQGLDGREIKFEDVSFTDKLAEHERHALHYKRFLILACGLDHRLKLFGEFYEGPASMEFVSLEFQDRYCRFLHDDPDGGTLLSEGRKPLSEWIAEKNAYLRSGSRVICNWRELMNPTTAPSACVRGHHSDSYERRYRPEHDHDVVIAHREGRDLCVSIEVKGNLLTRYGERTFNCKVNLSKFRDGHWDYTELPFLCLDAVEPEEVEWFIHHRESRSNHLSYIRFFKRALKYLVEERRSEQAARERLVGALEEGQLASGDKAREIVSQAAVAWRAAHRGRPLPTPADESSADWKSLLDQMYQLVHSGDDAADEAAAFIRGRGLTPLRLVLSGAAKLVVYAAPAPSERDDRLVPHSWVHAITLDRGKRGLKERSRRWALLPKQAASETTIHEWPEAADWVFENPAFSTPQRKESLLAAALAFRARLARHTEPLSEEAFEARVQEWLKVRTDLLKHSRFVENPELAIPVGLTLNKRGRLRYICVGSRAPHALLHDGAPTDEARGELRRRFAQAYARKDSGERQFDEAVDEAAARWLLMEVSAKSSLPESGYVPRDASASVLCERPSCDPRLSTWLDGWRKEAEQEGEKVWLAPDLFDASGTCVLDALLGIELPADYEPLNVVEVELSSAENGRLPKYRRWFDIAPRSPDEDAKERRSFMHRSELKSVPEGYEYSSHYHVEASRSAARELVQREARDAGLRAVRDKDLPEAEQAPKGYERWYLIED